MCFLLVKLKSKAAVSVKNACAKRKLVFSVIFPEVIASNRLLLSITAPLATVKLLVATLSLIIVFLTTATPSLI